MAQHTDHQGNSGGAATALRLPAADGTFSRYTMASPPPRAWHQPSQPPSSRVAYAAGHVVCDPLADNTPGSPPALDWDATLAFRHHLWSLGLGVAEAMDTAQRGMGVDWPTARELIDRSCAEARSVGGRIACGAMTDQLPAGAEVDLATITAAYEEQCAHIEASGGRVVIMASRHLAAAASGPQDYAAVYGKLLSQLREPAILHWLGPAFDPQLAGYWGSHDPDEAMERCLAVIEANVDAVAGIKVSMLDADLEIRMRRRLPPGVRLFTGDDFNYPQLIRGDDEGYSDALLGIFDPIAPLAATALRALDDGDVARFDQVLAPTVALSRKLFSAPTYHYKTGVVFLAWLNGHQRHFRMVDGREAARSVPHLCEVFVLADRAGVLVDPELAAERLRTWLAVAGVDA